MVYRIYVEKKPELANEAKALCGDLQEFLGIQNLDHLRIVNRYDAEDMDKSLFEQCIYTVFAEPQLDIATETLDAQSARAVFAVEFLPGQFDQRADSAAQCIQIISQGERPTIRTAKVYLLYGKLTEEEVQRIKKYVVNPVEAREASLEPVTTLKTKSEIPTTVETLTGFTAMSRDQLAAFLKKYALAMDLDDISFCQQYFLGEKRDPTITEIRMLDTYWSDHCRHTTFLTTIDDVRFEDGLLQSAYEDYLATRKALGRTKPVCLMDIATLAVKYLKKEGKLDRLDESEEINACTVKIDVRVDGETQPWLLLFKNETHNHPTEIEPFGGAATCIGGAIRDPLSGRSYVYGAMRVTGAANPLRPVCETLPGKLPQRKLTTTAAAGYSSYGNQIGLATGLVDEIYHDGYAAKRMEIGAVIAAAPAKNVRRERPIPGDVVILLGGRTGRDGCGGATGSSKSHTLSSLETCGAEVQKGNAPEERKLQRLFRNEEASLLIKRCNDFGAGGVSVAIGELADGLEIDLNAVPRKYEGLDGTELAISESQERMAVVVSEGDAKRFLALAAGENLEATVVARVTENPRLVMRWNGNVIVDISREFLNSNGAEKHVSVVAEAPKPYAKEIPADFVQGFHALADDLNVCSRRGLSERFDSTIGAGTVIMPFGGVRQLTPNQAMVQKISVEKGETDDCSLMAWGYNPFIAEKSPYHGAYLAVIESVAKLIATGAAFHDVYLTFQEYFEKPLKDPKRWGKPLSALLGAFEAQKQLGIAAIGGKDSMSGSFENLDVPPTLVSFAVTTTNVDHIQTNHLKQAGHRLALLLPEYDEHGLPVTHSLINLFNFVTTLIRGKKALSVWTPGFGGAAEAVMKMAFGNGIGVRFDDNLSMETLFRYAYGGFVVELKDGNVGISLGYTTDDGLFSWRGQEISLDQLLETYEKKLEPVFPCNIPSRHVQIPAFSQEAESRAAAKVFHMRPRVLIPVFPGTNCEYDSAKAMETAGAEAELFVINNLTADGIASSVERFAQRVRASQMIFIPGGFSGGDEPDGSGKFITAFFRNEAVKEAVTELLNQRDGLMCGICNGFQALIKLGLVPYGKIIEPDEHAPTLTFNTIGRHQSRLVRTRIACNKSPWLANTKVGDVYTVPISHGEGRFLADEAVIRALAENGQIATQYVDLDGNPTDDVRFNPNDSAFAIEGITSPDGRVFGKMGHSERIGAGLYKNVDGKYDMEMFRAAVQYFQ
ncbi:MAG: phosphoribosylformylglycinamidine synthase [Eubacteriales bacterium]|nr:phosphoribosylformylglycinamidine synthase [Eubacteriales bacterium]